jgi:hypothetical protein
MYFYWMESESSEGHFPADVSSVSRLAVLESIHLATLQFICGRNDAIDFDIVLSKDKQIALRAIIASIVREMDSAASCTLKQSSASTIAVVRCFWICTVA